LLAGKVEIEPLRFLIGAGGSSAGSAYELISDSGEEVADQNSWLDVDEDGLPGGDVIPTLS